MRGLSGWLYGVTIAASLVPALRASRIAPLDVLRQS